MHNIKILVAVDERPAGKKIRSYLKEQEGIDSIIEAENGIDAVEKIRAHKPDLALLDIQMPGMTGFEGIDAIIFKNMPVVIFVTDFLM
jgi:two-component system LytT family response regulator